SSRISCPCLGSSPSWPWYCSASSSSFEVRPRTSSRSISRRSRRTRISSAATSRPPSGFSATASTTSAILWGSSARRVAGRPVGRGGAHERPRLRSRLLRCHRGSARDRRRSHRYGRGRRRGVGARLGNGAAAQRAGHSARRGVHLLLVPVRVILKAEVRGLGRTGDIKDVADGYARNYLLPKGLAIEATGSELKHLAQERQAERTKKDRAHQDAEELAKRLAEVTLVFRLKAGEQGKTFGSV